MTAQLLAQSPLLALPLFALFVFVAVFLAIGVRTAMVSTSEVNAAAGLPLASEDEAQRDT